MSAWLVRETNVRSWQLPVEVTIPWDEDGSDPTADVKRSMVAFYKRAGAYPDQLDVTPDVLASLVDHPTLVNLDGDLLRLSLHLGIGVSEIDYEEESVL